MYKRLGMTGPRFDPRLVAPVYPLLLLNLFAKPVHLVPGKRRLRADRTP